MISSARCSVKWLHQHKTIVVSNKIGPLLVTILRLEIQSLADRNHSRAFFSATKEIYGPCIQGQVPLKSKDGSTILKTNKDINQRWREHFEGFLINFALM